MNEKTREVGRQYFFPQRAKEHVEEQAGKALPITDTVQDLFQPTQALNITERDVSGLRFLQKKSIMGSQAIGLMNEQIKTQQN